MKIAVFGGAFNPIHLGHVALAKELKQNIGAKKVLIIPSHLSPHKSSEQLVSGEDRLNMCRLAFEGMTGFEVSGIEIEMQGISYTANTLLKLKEQYPNDDIYLFMGADMFVTLNLWYEPQTIFSLCTLCTVPRNDIDADVLTKKANEYQKKGAKSVILDIPLYDVSSTELRNGLKTEHLPERVYEYIKAKGLYNGKIH
ncbi:MAG: nicotinate (nicotinamide) nucleotide adenylyltransferase [Clostridia bacterium]|nr:nicotinate (nicotinamide) nucleotide adenylyltransferase [Clostridia bacterium]